MQLPDKNSYFFLIVAFYHTNCDHGSNYLNSSQLDPRMVNDGDNVFMALEDKNES